MSLESRYKALGIYRQIAGADAAAEPEWKPVWFGRGFIQPISASESSRFEKLDEDVSHRLYCPPETPARYGDRVLQDDGLWIVVFATQADGIASTGSHKEVLLRSI